MEAGDEQNTAPRIVMYHACTDGKNVWTHDYRFARKLYNHWKKANGAARLYKEVYENEEGCVCIAHRVCQEICVNSLRSCHSQHILAAAAKICRFGEIPQRMVLCVPLSSPTSSHHDHLKAAPLRSGMTSLSDSLDHVKGWHHRNQPHDFKACS